MRVVLSALVAFLLASTSIPAEARRSSDHDYRYEQIWSSAVRLLRVDYGFRIRDRDRDIGFVLFDYQEHGRTYPGSLEVVRAEVGGQQKVRVTLNIPAQPSYVERMVLDRLQRKLRADFGEPIRRPVVREPIVEEAPSDDAENDDDDDERERSRS